MYKSIIVDDETKIREVLKIKLNEFCPNIDIIGLASNASEAFELINANKPDIVFLDIAMPRESGFDLIKKFDKITFEIIFVTGFDRYALDALKLSAIDYLLKPVKTDELISAVSKAIKSIEDRHKVKRYDVLKHNIENTTKKDDKITIPGENRQEVVKVSDIIRCEGWNRYTKIYLISGACVVSSYNIGLFKDLLKPYEFFQTHKSHIINNNMIEHYSKGKEVKLTDGSSVPISRRRSEEFHSIFLKIKKKDDR